MSPGQFGPVHLAQPRDPPGGGAQQFGGADAGRVPGASRSARSPDSVVTAAPMPVAQAPEVHREASASAPAPSPTAPR